MIVIQDAGHAMCSPGDLATSDDTQIAFQCACNIRRYDQDDELCLSTSVGIDHGQVRCDSHSEIDANKLVRIKTPVML